MAASVSQSSSSKLGLILLLICSSFFALYHSNSAYSSDEVWSVNTVLSDNLITALKADVHPPFYFQLLDVWVSLFGHHERAARSLSGLFYVLAILALYGLAKELYEDELALLCAALFACSPLAILSAQFARMYALLSLLSIVSTWLYVQFWIKDRTNAWRFVAFVIVNVLGTFTHIAFFFALFGQIVFHVIYQRTRFKKFVVAACLSVIPYLLLWTPVLRHQLEVAAIGLVWVKKLSFSMLWDVLFLYGGVLWLVLPVLLYLSWRRGVRLWSEIRSQQLLLLMLGFTIIPPLLISVVRPVFNSRLAMVGLHLFALGVAPFFRRMTGKYVLPLVLVLLTGAFLVAVRPAAQACDNRSLANYLVQNTRDNDVVIFTSLTRMPIDYYLGSRKLFETSFPGEIDKHPGYEGGARDSSRRNELEAEARELMTRIRAMRLGNAELRVFFLHGMHPEIDEFLEKELSKEFRLLSDQEVHCTEGSPYLKTISVYR
ncbi:MAG TPA: glycosyltransferase family 39 protein [Pyrinomonadaceae bacterium]|nr:glycosyltransferase family 39 protein [Pyrinomonadaceae bacterium]